MANGKNVAIRTLYKLSSKTSYQILALRFWHPSIKLGHETNLKGLMPSVLLD